jgi:DNA-binding NarL/FixJ family response regulator
MVPAIRLAIVDEHEIFRRGIQACLAEDPTIQVVLSESSGPLTEPADLALVSATMVSQCTFDCPVVVCGRPLLVDSDALARNRILGTIPRTTLTTAQLLAAVHAAAAGLHVDAEPPLAAKSDGLSARHIRVLRLLADGADTLEIAAALRYSERTVKSLIQEAEQCLGARSRAQAVALGVRRGLI